MNPSVTETPTSLYWTCVREEHRVFDFHIRGADSEDKTRDRLAELTVQASAHAKLFLGEVQYWCYLWSRAYFQMSEKNR